MYVTLYRGVRMKSKLLQKKGPSLDQSVDEIDDQRENTEGASMPWKGYVAPPIPINPAVDVEARNGFPGLLKRDYRPARS